VLKFHNVCKKALFIFPKFFISIEISESSWKVTLILGKEKYILEEESAFLAGISEFFEIMLYGRFAEANQEIINLPVNII